MTDASVPALAMRGVEKRFGGVIALAGVDLSVRSGSVHGLIGENGAGKSTLMKVLSGAHRSDAGTMSLNGHPYAPGSPHEGRMNGVAMIYQELTLATHLTVEENIALGREDRIGGPLGIVQRGAMRVRIREALEMLNRSTISPHTILARLSPGDRQLVEIARALVHRAQVLVLDEPTSSLGLQETQALFTVIRRLRDEGVAVIYISHFLEEVLELCDDWTVLRDGLTVGTGSIAGATIDGLVEQMIGRSAGALYPTRAAQSGEVVLALDQVAGRSKPTDVTLELRRGEILGIGGLIGSGRTEMVRAVLGLEPIRSGSIRVGLLSGGLQVSTHSSPSARLREGIGLLSEDRKGEGLALRLPIAVNTALSTLACKPWGSRFGWLSRRSLAATSTRMTKELGIVAEGPWQLAGQLSGGNQQKVALARLLATECDVLLLDEPTRGVDVGSKAQLYSVLASMADRGVAILAVCSYIPELLGLCDRVAVMYRGQLGEARAASDINEQDVLRAATTGFSLDARGDAA